MFKSRPGYTLSELLLTIFLVVFLGLGGYVGYLVLSLLIKVLEKLAA